MAVTYPIRTITISLLLTIVCSIGILTSELKSDGRDVWSPFESETRDQAKLYETFYPDDIKIANVYLQSKSSDSNMLADANIEAAFELYRSIVSMSTPAGSFPRVCFIPEGRTSCQVLSILAAWGFDNTLALQQTPSQRFATVFAAFPDSTSLVGGLDGTTQTMKSFNIFFYLSANETRGISVDDISDWEIDFLNLVQRQNNQLQIDALHSSSINDELSRAIGGDITLIAVGVILMISYSVAVITRKWTAVALRCVVPLSAVLSVFMGVGIGYGFTALSGVPFSALNTLLPLILLAIGIDNAYVLTAAWDARLDPSLKKHKPDHTRQVLSSSAMLACDDVSPVPTSSVTAQEAAQTEALEAETEHAIKEEEMDPEHTCGVQRHPSDDVHAKAAALAEEGATVLFTTTTDIVAFLFGSMTQVPAVHWFTLYAAASIAFILAMELTFFIACLELDTRRQASGRWECLCCAQDPVAAAINASVVMRQKLSRVGAKATLEAVVPSPPSALQFANPSLTKSTRLARWMKKHYVPLILNNKWQAAVIVFFAALLAFSGWAISQVPRGQPLSDLVPDDSYVVDWLDIRENLYDDAALNEFEVFATAISTRRTTAQAARAGEFDSAAAEAALNDNECTRHVRAAYAVRATLQRSHQWTNQATFAAPWWYSAWVAWLASPQGRAESPLPLLPANSSVVGTGGQRISYTLVNALSCQVFVSGISKWLQNSTSARSFAADVVLAVDNTTTPPTTNLQAARFTLRFLSSAVRDSTDQVDAVNGVRGLTRRTGQSFGGDMQAYTSFFFFTELDAIILDEAITNIGLAAAGVTVVALLFLGSVTSAFIVVFTLLLIDVFLLGLVYWAGLKINSVSIVNLILSLGLALDYSAHIAHSFSVHLRRLRRERAKKATTDSSPEGEMPDGTFSGANPIKRQSGAVTDSKPTLDATASRELQGRPAHDDAIDYAVSTLGASVVNGAVSTFLALVPLAPAGSTIFRTFFRMFSGITLLGGLPHGIVLLPVVLVLFAKLQAKCCRPKDVSKQS